MKRKWTSGFRKQRWRLPPVGWVSAIGDFSPMTATQKSHNAKSNRRIVTKSELVSLTMKGKWTSGFQKQTWRLPPVVWVL